MIGRRDYLLPTMAAIAAASGAVCLGYDGAKVRLPTARASAPMPFAAKSGLAIDVDTRWFGRGGYRPLRVRIEALAASNRDRVIDISLHTVGNRRQSRSPAMSLERQLVLPAGEQTLDALIVCPWTGDWQALWWELKVDGQLESQLSWPRGASWSVAQAGGPQRSLRLLRPTLAPDPDPASLRGAQIKRFGDRGSMLVQDARSELLSDWIAYSSADVIVLGIDELRQLFALQPEDAAALRRWILAGGSLWVERVDGSPERYVELDQRLGLSAWRFTATAEERPDRSAAAALAEAEAIAAAADDAESEDDEPTPKRRRDLPVEGAPGWSYLNLADKSDAKELAKRVTEQLRVGDPASALRSALSSVADSRGWFAVRDAGFGKVFAFDRTPLTRPIGLTRVAVDAGIAKWTERNWPQRHGVEPGMTCPSFGNLLIPGVGVAPVGEFQVLITLFVLAIGPLNYWLLWRRNQLHLLVLTTPLAALVVTLGLAGYAAVSDGFGVKARVRSLTMLNQATGEAASWSRVSHYVAAAPDEPAVFPGDAVLTPIRPAWESAIAAAPESRSLTWQDGDQVLTSGWIPSRTATQHLIVRSRVTTARIAFSKQGESLQATNNLNAPLQLLLVYDEQRNWRMAEGVDTNATTPLPVTTRLEALQAFRGISLKNQPAFPIGAGKAVEQTLELLGESSNLRRRQRQMSDAALTTNLLNNRIAALTGLDGGIGLDLPTRSYVAVATSAVETPLGWDDVQEVDSFHVVAGRW